MKFVILAFTLAISAIYIPFIILSVLVDNKINNLLLKILWRSASIVGLFVLSNYVIDFASLCMYYLTKWFLTY